MSDRTEAIILADTYDFARNLTRFYMGKLKGQDMKRVFTVNGTDLNSAYWLVAHLVWAENFLLLQTLGGPEYKNDWIQNFGFGSDSTPKEDWPDFREVLDAFKEIHVITLDFLRSIPDEKMDAPNLTGVGFGGEPTFRTAIQHAIRHEANHTGHLGWLCKLYGAGTV